MDLMRSQITFIAAAAAAALSTLALPGLASAQSQPCLDYLASYCGPLAMNECFVPEFIPQEVPAECIGDVQMLYEMANEADQQAYEEQHATDPGYEVASVSAGEGFSYGGNLRDGPGDAYSIVGSLPEGSFAVLEPSGVWSGGYQWFWVTTDLGSAYHWGGLVCSYNQYVDGVLDVC